MFTQLLVILENRDILLMIQLHNYADSNTTVIMTMIMTTIITTILQWYVDNNHDNDNDNDVTVIWR